jgi:Fur family zinc uptake transcriptional regulator
MRAAVLEALWAHEREAGRQPVGAYALLTRLSAAHGTLAPPTVYRALDFLVAHGLAHKLATRNAYIACVCLGDHAASAAFLICQGCGQAAEMTDPAVPAAIDAAAAAADFAVDQRQVEVLGRCSACRVSGHPRAEATT